MNWLVSLRVPGQRQKGRDRDAASAIAEADWRNSSAILWPVIITCCMALTATITVAIAGIDVSRLLGYVNCAAVTLLCILAFVFVEVARLGFARADDPLGILKDRFARRGTLLLLPAVVLPLFLMSYTAAKSAIPYIVGYSWDGFWANADRLIFGDDVWRIARRLLGTSYLAVWEWFYSAGWTAAFLLVTNAVALYGKPRFVGVYYSAMLGTWFVGGCVMAYAFSAAGPVFAALFDPALSPRFGTIAHLMNASVGINPIATSQHYLEVALRHHVAAQGGGISAMPSMHLGTCSVFVLAARRTRWLIPAVAFWTLIFIASGYFGYHYWTDGIAAAILAAVMWRVSEAIYSRGSASVGHAPSASAVAVTS